MRPTVSCCAAWRVELGDAMDRSLAAVAASVRSPYAQRVPVQMSPLVALGLIVLLFAQRRADVEFTSALSIAHALRRRGGVFRFLRAEVARDHRQHLRHVNRLA